MELRRIRCTAKALVIIERRFLTISDLLDMDRDRAILYGLDYVYKENSKLFFKHGGGYKGHIYCIGIKSGRWWESIMEEG